MVRLLAALAIGLVLASSIDATAQSASNASQTEIANLNARNLAQKRDLAGVLGEVHYIRTLCNGQDDQFWRNHMRAFLDIEAASRDRRRMLVDAFNRGYARIGGRVNRCTAEVARMEARLSQRGRKLAQSIAAGYLQ